MNGSRYRNRGRCRRSVTGMGLGDGSRVHRDHRCMGWGSGGGSGGGWGSGGGGSGDCGCGSRSQSRSQTVSGSWLAFGIGLMTSRGLSRHEPLLPVDRHDGRPCRPRFFFFFFLFLILFRSCPRAGASTSSSADDRCGSRCRRRNRGSGNGGGRGCGRSARECGRGCGCGRGRGTPRSGRRQRRKCGGTSTVQQHGWGAPKHERHQVQERHGRNRLLTSRHNLELHRQAQRRLQEVHVAEQFKEDRIPCHVEPDFDDSHVLVPLLFDECHDLVLGMVPHRPAVRANKGPEVHPHAQTGEETRVHQFAPLFVQARVRDVQLLPPQHQVPHPERGDQCHVVDAGACFRANDKSGCGELAHPRWVELHVSGISELECNLTQVRGGRHVLDQYVVVSIHGFVETCAQQCGFHPGKTWQLLGPPRKHAFPPPLALHRLGQVRKRNQDERFASGARTNGCDQGAGSTWGGGCDWGWGWIGTSNGPGSTHRCCSRSRAFDFFPGRSHAHHAHAHAHAHARDRARSRSAD
jgi:hypothetical protein